MPDVPDWYRAALQAADRVARRGLARFETISGELLEELGHERAACTAT